MSARVLSDGLAASAGAHADRPAVLDGDQTWSYGELERRVNQVARLMREAGIGRGDRVGLYLDKSPEAILAIHGILRAGAAYVPLDPQAPVARLGYIARDCDLRCLLTAGAKRARWRGLRDAGAPIESLLVLDEDEPGDLPPGVRGFGRRALAAQSTEAPSLRPRGDDLAYVLYTSGSTGTPKGVMLSHGNGRAFVDWARATFGVTPQDRLSSHAPLHFDLSIFDVFAASGSGAAVVLFGSGASVFPIELARRIDRDAISIWYSVPSILALLAQRGGLGPGDLPALRTVLFAGEVLAPKHLRRLKELLPGTRLCNLYGPTETNVCTWHDARGPIGDGPIPIGREIDGVELIVLGEDGRSVEPGETGELLVSGPTVMQGYWGDAVRTAAVLVADPLGRPGHPPAYKTGDLVRELPGGELEFLGRRDTQVKSRGYRIELGDVEAALLAHPSVTECAVVAIPDADISSRLAAVVVAGHPLGARELSRFCAERLPGYMVPLSFDMRGALPRTSTGKIDRRMLADELAASAGNGGRPRAAPEHPRP